MSLITYDAQVSFLKRHIKSGSISQGGTWHGPGAIWGKMWSGRVCGYVVTFQTIGDGPYLRAGSFKVRAVKEDES